MLAAILPPELLFFLGKREQNRQLSFQRKIVISIGHQSIDSGLNNILSGFFSKKSRATVVILLSIRPLTFCSVIKIYGYSQNLELILFIYKKWCC